MIFLLVLVYGFFAIDISQNVDYDQVLKKVDQLSSKVNYIKYYDAYKLFSFDSPKCGEINCTYPFLEIYDQSIPLQKVNQFPTLLISTGFYMSKKIKNISLDLLNVIENMIDNQVQFITKNFRLLVIPMLNPINCYKMEKYEKIDDKNINFINDFPMYFDNQKCFQTDSSKILQAIFNKYLVSMSVFLEQGDNLILYPYSSISNTINKPQDYLVFEDISNHFAKIFKNIFQQEFKYSQYKEQKLDSSNMLDWFYSASWNKSYINNKCSQQESHNNFIDKYSNRSLPFYFQIKENHSQILQVIISESLNFLTPNIQLLSYDFQDGINIMKLKIKGCLQLERIGIINGLDHQKKDDYIEKETGHIIVSLEIYNEKYFNKNFIIEMNCDYKWNQIFEEYFPQSLFTRQKIDYNFEPENEVYKLSNRFGQQIQLLDFRIDANLDQVYTPEWNQIQLFYEQSLIARLDFLSIIFNQINKNQVVLDISFDQSQTRWKLEEFEIFISQYGDLGYYDQQAIGSLIKIDSNLIMEKTQLKDLLGLYLVVKQKEFGFQYISLIQLQDSASKDGYQIPQQGVTCIQNKRLDYVYVDIQSVNIKKTKIKILTNKYLLNEMTVNNNLNTKLFLQNQFKNPELGIINIYENTINQQAQEHEILDYQQYVNFQNQLLGGLIEIYDQNKQKIFSCRTGIKNPFYDEEINLRYSIMSQPFQPEDKEEDLFWKSVFSFLITLGAIVLLFIFYKLCKKKKSTDISKERIKIEENYFQLMSNISSQFKSSFVFLFIINNVSPKSLS